MKFLFFKTKHQGITPKQLNEVKCVRKPQLYNVTTANHAHYVSIRAPRVEHVIIFGQQRLYCILTIFCSRESGSWTRYIYLIRRFWHSVPPRVLELAVGVGEG